MTTGEVYIDFIKELKTIYEEREAETISDWVFENVTGMKRWERRANQNKDLKENELEQVQKYLSELLHHKPAQYVLNEAWFYKMKFFVNEDVLIPRPETEELVEWIVNDFDSGIFKSSKPINILDIGSGSGCISISLKKELPEASITGIDISEKALSVAKKNAEDLKVEIEFLRIDFLNEKAWSLLEQYDIIVSNPPYIPIKENNILKRNVVDFEPGIALFVENDHPFIFYQEISEFAKTHLKEKGRIYVEVHEEYADNVKAILNKAGLQTTLKKDIYEKNRMVRAIKLST